MKYICLFFVSFLLLTIGLSGCGNKSNNPTSSSKSLVFMEIPIEGNVNSFGEKLEQRGYYYNGDDTLSNQIGYKGIYMNKPVLIVLYYDGESRDINIVRTWFREGMPDAAEIIKEYTDKYGECKMKADYGSIFYTWEVEGGFIGLVSNFSFIALDYSIKELEY